MGSKNWYLYIGTFLRSTLASVFRKWAFVVQLDFWENNDYNKEQNININLMGLDHTKQWSFDYPLGHSDERWWTLRGYWDYSTSWDCEFNWFGPF